MTISRAQLEAYDKLVNPQDPKSLADDAELCWRRPRGRAYKDGRLIGCLDMTRLENGEFEYHSARSYRNASTVQDLDNCLIQVVDRKWDDIQEEIEPGIISNKIRNFTCSFTKEEEANQLLTEWCAPKNASAVSSTHQAFESLVGAGIVGFALSTMLFVIIMLILNFIK